jgi:hypothetical protein
LLEPLPGGCRGPDPSVRIPRSGTDPFGEAGQPQPQLPHDVTHAVYDQAQREGHQHSHDKEVREETLRPQDLLDERV